MSRGTRSLAPALVPSLAFWALLAASAAGCPSRTPASGADASDGPAGEIPPPLTLDIAITGCTDYEPAPPRCSGPAPLSLSFSPVGSPQFMRFTWTFGDGTPLATDRAPLHTYLLPGSYEVDLVGAFGGANTVASKAVVDVKARDVGQPCDLDLQCAGGLRCACAPGTGCSPAFLRGLCSTPCDSVACDLGVCAALALAPAPAADGGPAVLPWCVEGCQTSADCAPGFRCETLAAAGVAGPGTWTRGCLPIGALGDIGATCRDATGALADTACATGSCIDLGALGTCSATCDGDRTCPDKTACALMPDGRRLCLVDCNAPGASCARDPLLACVAPMNATPPSADGGATGFRADGGAGASYCAPKPCASDTDCAPAGLCGPGAQCVR